MNAHTDSPSFTSSPTPNLAPTTPSLAATNAAPATSSKTEPASTKSNRPFCQYRTRTGRQCRSRVSTTRSSFCSRHSAQFVQESTDSAIAADLLGEDRSLKEFASAYDINLFLSRLLLLLAEDRIAPRRAAVMAYTCNLLLHSLRDIDREDKAAENTAAGQQILIDVVRPRRDPSPVAASA